MERDFEGRPVFHFNHERGNERKRARAKQNSQLSKVMVSRHLYDSDEEVEPGKIPYGPGGQPGLVKKKDIEEDGSPMSLMIVVNGREQLQKAPPRGLPQPMLTGSGKKSADPASLWNPTGGKGKYKVHDVRTGWFVSNDSRWLFHPNDWEPTSWVWKHAATGLYYRQDPTTMQYQLDESLSRAEAESSTPKTAAKRVETHDDDDDESEAMRLEKNVPFHGELDMPAHSESWPGRKPSNEDRVCSAWLSELGSYVALFDGHGGIQAADYSLRKMHRNILSAHRSKMGFGEKAKPPTEQSITAAIIEGVEATDREFLNIAHRKEWKHDGTTANFCLIHGHSAGLEEEDDDKAKAPKRAKLEKKLKLYCGNLGDSRAVMCRSGKAVALSHDHKPDRKDEKKRIESVGGVVIEVEGVWRCCRQDHLGLSKRRQLKTYLSTSRTIGDMQLKAPTQVVSATPEVKAVDITEEDTFIVIACDGIWDVLSDQQVVDIALIFAETGDAEEAAKSIVREAFEKESLDNITATVVYFGWAKEKAIQQLAAKVEQAENPTVAEEDDFDMFGD